MAAFPVSVASYSVHSLLAQGKLDVFGYLELLSGRYGVRHADIWNGFLPTLEEGFLKKVREELDRRELTLANLCVDGPHPWDPEAEVRKQHDALALEYIEAAKLLGAKTIRIDMGEREPEFSNESFDYIANAYRKYAKLCGDAGMKIGPENHWGASKYPHNLKRMREAINHPAYGHLLHLEGFLGGSQDAGYEVVIPIAMHTHIPANAIPAAKEVLRRLAAAGYKGAYSVEHHSERLELERTAWQLASLRCMLAELNEEGLGSPAKPDYFREIYYPIEEGKK
jgi:sugar phosphate isomerase/epimerase